MKKKLLKRCGIADAHGLETYRDYDTTPPLELLCFFLRAESNRQRHAVMFIVEVTEKVDAAINKLTRENKFADALSLLKASTKSIQFPRTSVEFYSKSWSLIPNPKLDPWN